MTTTRKRRVTLIPADELGDTVTPSHVTTVRAEDKLMTRASKRRKLALSNSAVTSEEPTEAVKPALPVVESEGNIKRSTKVKRQAWTSTGMVIFFEALAEHGKDFGKILNYMCAKEKKKKQRDPFIENLTKNQVRFFYYRTWHKVSSLLTLGERDEESPNQKRLQKTRGVPIPPGDVPKGCGGSDEETEGETEAAFDMSLDEGEDCQDGCPDHVTSSVVNIEDGDSLLPGSHYSDPSPFSDPTSQLPEHPSIDKEAGSSEEQNVFLDGAGVDDTTNDGVDIVGVVSNGVGSEVGKNEKKKLEAGHSGGGMVMVNGAWQSLDLVAMICYNKMRLKCRADNKVLGRKLKEMVYKGTTTIRVKGKRRKEMKIPNCAALKSTKTNIVSSSCAGESGGTIESSPMETIPALSVTLELRPLNSGTWSYVQQLSMNPRLRLNVSSSRTVKDLFHLISAKWHILPKEVFNVVKLFVAPSKQKDQSEECTGSVVPLELEPLMTIGELNTRLCGSTSKTKPSKLSLQYEISLQQADTSERNLEHLLKLATVLTSQHTPDLAPPTTPPNTTLTSTPTSVPSATPSISTSSLISSPVVQQYIKTMPKKSPLKSPLTKYKRMKHLRPSPLKASRQSSAVAHKIKPIQLQFPSSQTPHNSPTVSKSKHGEQGKRTPHLVTLSKNCLSQSGSFTGLRLEDIFHSVNENLKGAQSTKPRKSSNIVVAPLPEDKEIKTVGNADKADTPTQSSSPATTTTNKSTVVLPHHMHTEGLPTHLAKASPLEQLASRVSSIPAMQQKKQKPGTSSAYQINIVTTGITTPLASRPPAIASPTGRPATTTATKPARRNPNSQRPVVPKPLIYLPQFAKQLASLHMPPLSQSAPNQFTQPKQHKLTSHLTTSQSTASSITSPSSTGHIHFPSSQTALNTQDLLQAQARLLHELLTKPSSQNGKDEQKRQQAVQTLLHSLVTLGSQFPALLQKLDLKALLSAAVQSKSSLGKDIPLTSIKSQGLPTSATASSTSTTSAIRMPVVNDVIPSSSVDSNNLLSSLQDFGSVYGPSSIGNGQDPIYTSSDTVTELLKGLSPNNNQQTEKESVIRLSEETADVLPSFARAMIHLNTTESSSKIDHNNGGLPNALSSPSDEDSSTGSTDALAGILLPSGGNLESISDTSFKNIVDSTDYNEVFAQLKDILRTPERPSVSKSLSSQDSDGGMCQAKSHGEIIPSDSFSSPFKTQQSSSDHGLRSILEENSVDYINKFKELASAMNHTS